MSNLILLLVAVATAFPAGWLICRAWSQANRDSGGTDGVSREQHHKMLQTQRSRYRQQVQRVADLVRRHEAARDQLLSKLGKLEEQSSSQQQQNRHLQKQLDESREALARANSELQDLQSRPSSGSAGSQETEKQLEQLRSERDELRAQLTQASAASASNAEQASGRAERGELREKLSTAEHRLRELETRLQDRDSRIEELERTVESWKHRVAPLTRQIQTYREAIQKMQRGARPTPGTPAPAESELPADDLQKIRGIGPALERRLNANGIRRYEQIAALEPIELAALADRLAIAPKLPERDEWIRQARELAASDGVAAAAV